MKQIFVSVLLVFLLASCSDKKVKLDYPILPLGTVSTSYNDIAFKAELGYDAENNMQFEMTSPAEMKGIVFSFIDDKLVLIKDDLMLEYDRTFSETVPLLMLNSIINGFNSKKPEFISIDNELKADIDINNVSYEMIYDSQNKNIKRIQANSLIFEFN